MSKLAFWQAPVLAYHKIGWPTELGITTVLPSAFERQMRFLADAGYRSLHPDQLVRAIQKAEPLPSRSVLITFDDGYASVYEVAYPILKRLGFTATIFINTAYIGQRNAWDVYLAWKRCPHLTWRQLQELSEAGFCIASHGVHHRFLTRASTLRTELETSRQQLAEKLGVCVDYLAYPYGAWNFRVLEHTRQAGYRAAFAYVPRPFFENLYALPRIGVYLPDTLRNFCAKLGLRGQRAFQWECAKHRCIHAFTYANLWRPGYWLRKTKLETRNSEGQN